MNGQRLITVIIPTLDKKELLKECLESLQKQTLSDFSIVVIDNASSDGTSEMLEKDFPSVLTIRNPKNKGFVAVNQGIKMAKTKYIVLLNNDAVAKEDWLENLLMEMEGKPSVSFAASKILQFNDRTKIDSAGDGFNLNIMAGYSIGKGDEEKNHRQSKYCFSATGGAAIYRRELFDKIGFFDKKFFAYFEDIDFGFRANLAGFKCIFIPSAIVYHRGGETSVHNSRFHLSLTDRNKVATVLKNVPIHFLLKYRRATFNLFFWPFVEVLKLNFSVWPFILNRIVLVLWLPNLLWERIRIGRSRVLTDEELEQVLI